MKRLILRIWLFILATTGVLPTWAQTADQVKGIWKGTIQLPGFQLELSLSIDQALHGTMDIPVQGIHKLPLEDLVIAEEKISFKLPVSIPGNASFWGKFTDTYSRIEGTFTQSGQQLPLGFLKENEATAVAIQKNRDAAVARIKTVVDSFRNLQKIPAIGLGIIKDGQIILAEGFGYRRLSTRQPATANTLFAIGSSTKAFTAFDVALLAEKGLLEWDEPIKNYLPDFQLWDEFATQEMTAADLLSHQSGLPRHDLMWYGSSLSRSELYQRLKYLEPTKSFRSAWQYQNLMYLTAGILVEKISGATWEDFTKKNIFQPLQMDHSVFSAQQLTPEMESALPYRKVKEEVIEIPHRDIAAIGPAGSIYSNVNDMLKWVKLHLEKGKPLLPENQTAQLHKPHKVIEADIQANFPEISHRSYGLGWFVYRLRDKDIVQHGGNIDGFSALVFMAPKENLGMVILTNMNGTAIPGIIANTVLDILLEEPPVDWYARVYDGQDKKVEEQANEEAKPVANTKPSKELTEYTGKYEHPGYGIMEVNKTSDGLLFLYNGIDMQGKHWHYDVFKGRNDLLDLDMFVQFELNKQGDIEALSAPLEPSLPDDIVFKKLAPPMLEDPGYMEKLSGTYIMDGSVEVVFEYKNGKFTATLPGQPVYELMPLKKDWFQLKNLNGYSVEFVIKGKENKATQAKFHQPNGVFTAQRQ